MTEVPEAKPSMMFSWSGLCVSSDNNKTAYDGFNLNGVTFNIGDCGESSDHSKRDSRPFDCNYDIFNNDIASRLKRIT